MDNNPLISVVMPVYQSGDFIGNAIDSILKQTLTDFELIIIVDEPSVSIRQTLDRFTKEDNRITVYYHENRLGLIGSLNFGCTVAKGIYIARMDADDISTLNRLQIQYDFLENHPDIGIVGAWVDYIDTTGKKIKELRSPISPNVIRWRLYFGNVIAHPTVMIRRSVIDRIGYYSNDAKHAEDYDLWVRASRLTDLANIPEVLLNYRIHDGSICSNMGDPQELIVVKVSQNAITELLGKAIPFVTIKNLRNTVIYKPLDDPDQAESVDGLIQTIYETYKKQHKLSHSELKEINTFTGKMFFKLSFANDRLPLIKRIKFLSEVFKYEPLFINILRRID